jgi:hypothetical protein
MTNQYHFVYFKYKQIKNWFTEKKKKKKEEEERKLPLNQKGCVKKLNHSEVARTRGGGHPDTLFNC